jgi:ParB family transcriptional regulator, chromosome partitioning protein
MARSAAPLQEITPDHIKPNPDNPRLVFREDEMNELLESIREVGIKVPISVYVEGNRFTLIDGERRWRCARKLNLRTLPAIVMPKPSRLENLLMMFNIHNVRVDWDLMPMALKLGEIRDMIAKEGKPTSPKALAAVTGVRVATVRRALELLDLPKRYQRLLLKEGEKPRDQQHIKVDLFIEVYKSLHAVERHMPEVLNQVSKTQYVDAMVGKYVNDVVDNVVAYRNVSKIARAHLAGGDKKRAAATLTRLIKEPDYSVAEAYEDTVKGAYDQRDVLTRVRSLVGKLREMKRPSDLDNEVREALTQLNAEITRLLR